MIATNADEYAAPRLNVFFPGVDPSLDGQCVSLVKWFLQEMTEVPNPQAARGDARYVGKRLVAEGHAVEVAYADRRRGDIVCYEYGTYGHIGVVLSGNRTFEQNVNVGGAARKTITQGKESWYVYASRIGTLSESWRHDMHIYRIKSYKENDDMSTVGEIEFNNLWYAMFGPMERNYPTANDRKRWIGGETNTVIRSMNADPRRGAYLQYVNDLEKAVQNPSTPAPTPDTFMPYTGPPLYVKPQK